MITMQAMPFVDIRTLLNDKDKCDIGYLLKIYQDYDNLLQIVDEVLYSHICSNQIIGKKILLKPNWVRHDTKVTDRFCLRTDNNIVLAITESIAKNYPREIVIGDAPIQGCIWDKILNREFVSHLQAISVKYGIPIEIKDFRRIKYNMQNNIINNNCHSMDNYVIVDVGEKSYLESVCNDRKKPFRVTCYNYKKLAEFQRKGIHKYCIAKDLFDADLVLSIPKIKTHQKTGLTNSLKNIVGLNGDKDYLPHHRKGCIANGGDCYPEKSILRTSAEYILDIANQYIGSFAYHPLICLSSILWKLSKPTKEQNEAAGWYGNDTTWRMVMDLNEIINYGTSDGKLADIPQRKFYSFCDGIIAGHGDGPLNPIPLNLGVLAFTNNSYLMDFCTAKLLGMMTEKIPLIKEAEKFVPSLYDLQINGKSSTIQDLDDISVKAVMPPGWLNYNK